MPISLSPRKRFLLMLIIIYGVSLPIISLVTFVILRDNAIRDAYSTGKLYLSTVEAIRHYVSDELRPSLYKELPGRFILQGMSRSYAANAIAAQVQQKYPGYRYKNATLMDPMNPRNKADEFETGVIESFIRKRNQTEWQGIRGSREGNFFVIARPGEAFSAECLYCHGDPAVAPREVIDRYGTEGGFGRSIGQLVDGKFVYIPIDVPLAAAKKSVTIFIALYTLFFGVVFAVINVRFSALYNQIETKSRRIEEINADLTMLNEELESLMTERTMNLVALTVADRVRNPVAVIGRRCSRILEREKLPETVEKDLKDIVQESENLETMVRDFESFLKSRQSQFHYEDINEIVRAFLPAIEKEARDKGVRLSVELSKGPLRMNAQRGLLRAAIFHLIRNALEATPEGGTVTFATGQEGDEVQIRVKDTGPGIPPDATDRIFEPFFSTKPYRFGVGLPLVKQIVSEHLGRITVSSNPGEGTTFTVLFPARWAEKKQL